VKRFFKIFELSKNEQRVVLIIMLVLLTIAFVAYERRIHPRLQQITAMDPTPSPRALKTQADD
jgi:hypothetical protein